VHGVWATKNRLPLINDAAEPLIYEWLAKEMDDMACELRAINGMPDHVHVLFRLTPKLALMDVVKQLKGNTTKWINERSMLADWFDWQTGYGAFSVSEQRVPVVERYIQRQKFHHQSQTFDEEFEYLVRMHGMLY
jgi:REP element-mobilizing transposase RayT